MSFENSGLNSELIKTITRKGYEEMTPIQGKAIPVILQGRDVLGGAQTGTGKTAAFALPVIQLLGKSEAAKCPPRALVITPTRELATQVKESFDEYGESSDLVSITIYGGVGYTPQIEKLKIGVDIIVACPGRLLDLAKQGSLVLDNIEILVLDEADRMLDMGFSFEIGRILKMLPEKRQTLLFSATYSEEIKKLADKVLTNPELIEVSPQNKTAETVEQVVIPVRKEQKRILLSKLIREENWSRVLVFTKTKYGAENLKDFLIKEGIKVRAIHGNKSQAARNWSLKDFKDGIISVLVATDVAARGLDISDLPYVVNFDLPIVPEDYIHRIGRTGRAGNEGIAISLVSGEDQPLVWKIEKLIKSRISIREIEGFRQETKEELECARALKRIHAKKNDKKKPRSPRKNNYGKNSDETVRQSRSRKVKPEKEKSKGRSKNKKEVEREQQKKRNEDNHFRRVRAAAKKRKSTESGNSSVKQKNKPLNRKRFR